MERIERVYRGNFEAARESLEWLNSYLGQDPISQPWSTGDGWQIVDGDGKPRAWIAIMPGIIDGTFILEADAYPGWGEYVVNLYLDHLAKWGLLEAKALPPVTDPTDQRILALVEKDPDLSDQAIGQRIGLSRGRVNERRNGLAAMGYKVR